jgi:hypothetical protein
MRGTEVFSGCFGRKLHKARGDLLFPAVWERVMTYKIEDNFALIKVWEKRWCKMRIAAIAQNQAWALLQCPAQVKVKQSPTSNFTFTV